MNSFLGCKFTLLLHVEFLVNQHLQVLLIGAAFNQFSAQTVSLLEIALAQMQDLVRGLVEPHTVHIGPAIKPVWVLLCSNLPLQHVNCTTQLGVVLKLVQVALNPIVHIANKDASLAPFIGFIDASLLNNEGITFDGVDGLLYHRDP